MASLNGLPRLAALSLLVAAAACGESATELAKADRQRAASPNEEIPDITALVVPPVFSMTMKYGKFTQVVDHTPPPGVDIPTGNFYMFDVRASGLAPNRGYEAQSLGRFRQDGTVFLTGAAGGGRILADGNFRMGIGYYCPSPFSEMWVVVTTAGRTWESPHYEPPC